MSEQTVFPPGGSDWPKEDSLQDNAAVSGHDRESTCRQYRLPLRGHSLNPMIDAATPLLGMVMRVAGMHSNAMPENLFAIIEDGGLVKSMKKRNRIVE